MTSPSRFYTVGGTLMPESPSYITRKADQDLYDSVTAGDLCHVLTSRQMGKSSLMIRTAQRLRADGFLVADVDLTEIGTASGGATVEPWCYGLADEIHGRLHLDADLDNWWEQQSRLAPIQRLGRFLRELVLGQTNQRVVIFLDEIDSTINLDFKDDFFATIRACHNNRARDSEYKRLTFVLLGVARADELIVDSSRTPFNVGHHITLTDFTFDEARPLMAGLDGGDETSEQTLKRVLHWTGGHPYLTQKICELATQEPGVSSGMDIDRIVRDNFLAPGADRKDYNLSFVRNRLSRPNADTNRALKVYGQILRDKQIADDVTSSVIMN